MSLLRTDELENKYIEHRKNAPSGVCALWNGGPTKKFTYWKIMENNFPYDLIANTHDMIVTKRHVEEDGLNKEELEESKTIKKEVLNKEYQFIMEATYKTKSIPAHHHLHLLIIKDKII